MTAEPLGDDPIHRAAREALGYARLRPGQHEAIAALVDGRDCFAVLPGARSLTRAGATASCSMAISTR
jgi:hypothetical protein